MIQNILNECRNHSAFILDQYFMKNMVYLRCHSLSSKYRMTATSPHFQNFSTTFCEVASSTCSQAYPHKKFLKIFQRTEQDVTRVSLPIKACEIFPRRNGINSTYPCPRPSQTNPSHRSIKTHIKKASP